MLGDSSFAADSPLEGDGFEPSVSRKIFWLPRRSPQFTFRNVNTGSLATTNPTIWLQTGGRPRSNSIGRPPKKRNIMQTHRESG